MAGVRTGIAHGRPATRLLRQLAVAQRTVDVLASAGWSDPRSADAVSAEKVRAELALLLRLTRDDVRSNPELAGLHRSLAEQLWSTIEIDRLLAEVVLDPGASLDHAYVYLCLRDQFEPVSALDSLLAAATTGPIRERLPHRDLEQAYLASILGIDHSRGWAAAAQSILATPLDAVHASRADLYAFTHAVMFGTAFGSRSLARVRRHDAIALDADAGLVRSIDEDDFDLAGEFAMCRPLLGEAPSEVSAFGVALMRSIEDDLGFLPSNVTSTASLLERAAAERPGYALASAYHTVFVAALLETIVPPATSDRGGEPLIDAGERPLWVAVAAQRHLAIPPDFERDVALVRAARARDVASARDLLALDPERPSAIRAAVAALLDRAAVAGPGLVPGEPTRPTADPAPGVPGRSPVRTASGRAAARA